MGWLADLQMYARFARKLPSFLAREVSPARGRELLAERLGQRDRNFLAIAEREVYAHPGSPYLALLREAGCELGDLRRMISERGLEATLDALRRAGVVVRFEQFKGREPLVVGGREIPVGPHDFHRRELRAHLESFTSGSTGGRTRVVTDLDHRAARAAVEAAIRQAQGLLDLPRAVIVGRLPESARFGGAFEQGRNGRPPERWFTPVLSPPRKPELRFRLAHGFVTAVARLYGVRIPRPEPLPAGESVRVARWAARTVREQGACSVRCTPSMALRICVAARREGIDLSGTTFSTGGEPLTEAKKAGILAAGAAALCSYHMKEAGMIGAACVRPHGPNDQHVMTPHLALVQSPRRVGDREVGALLVTNLLATSPRVLLNLETDDYGVLEERRCGCPLEALGLELHVRDVRSYKKLTAEGVTLVGSEMEHVLESVLPERFGGSALDYQLVEEEDEAGFTRICIRVSPAVEIADERRIVEAVLTGLRSASISADLAFRLWNETGAIRVERVQPPISSRGKLLTLQSRSREETTSRAGGAAWG